MIDPVTDLEIGRLERNLGRLLFAGVVSASALLLAGLVMWMLHLAPQAANALLNAGLIVLMATPLLRVIVSLVEYVRMRDWFFVATTLAVLGVLLTSVTIALRYR
jgi:uncharacterized membrane protein